MSIYIKPYIKLQDTLKGCQNEEDYISLEQLDPPVYRFNKPVYNCIGQKNLDEWVKVSKEEYFLEPRSKDKIFKSDIKKAKINYLHNKNCLSNLTERDCETNPICEWETASANNLYNSSCEIKKKIKNFNVDQIINLQEKLNYNNEKYKKYDINEYIKRESHNIAPKNIPSFYSSSLYF